MHTTREAPLTIPLAVAIAVAIAILGAFVGSGALGGTAVNEAADGWLGADATLLAPAGSAFSIWSVIYLGLAVYAVWQLLPAARRSNLQARVRVLCAASAVLNALWIGSIQLGWLGISVVVMLLLLLTLILIFRVLAQSKVQHTFERWIMWLTFGPYLGWVSVATLANIAAWLSSLGISATYWWSQPAAVVLLMVATLIGAASVLSSSGKISMAMAMVWGIAWIGVGRSEGESASGLVSVSAYILAALLLFFALASAWRLRVRAAPSVS
ncbi:tryptophan-rich sensory protein [Arthrobacter sp. MYb227]|uniref:TspO/MBR family protein n=1 Tax=Arthrobacter sp. MYb227 TaxID=1848601 RepID=UPI000CFD9030|nr:TspO/MBR family protein [Arthrobacter sp. MYb227]PQZ94886.1 tryptophan-rich sensory protein [Arthrobacter sp. MYb227]